MLQLPKGRHQMVVGDIKETYAHQMDVHGLPDYLFLDSYHSRGFGMWYGPLASFVNHQCSHRPALPFHKVVSGDDRHNLASNLHAVC